MDLSRIEVRLLLHSEHVGPPSFMAQFSRASIQRCSISPMQDQEYCRYNANRHGVHSYQGREFSCVQGDETSRYSVHI